MRHPWANTLLLFLLLLQLATGLGGLVSGAPRLSWLLWLHGLGGYGLAGPTRLEGRGHLRRPQAAVAGKVRAAAGLYGPGPAAISRVGQPLAQKSSQEFVQEAG